MTKMHMVGAINNALEIEMGKDESVICLGEDVGVDGGVFRVTDGLFDKYGENRVIDSPLGEAGIIGVSTALAINGIKPVAEIQFIGFAYQGFYHLKQHVARFRQRSSGDFTCPLVVRGPCSGGIKALEHHSESPESFFTHCHGFKVVCPSGPYDAKGLLISSIRDPDPVVFLEPAKNYRSFKEEVPDEEYTIPLGDANIIKEGKDITIVTWGSMVRVCNAAAEKLTAEGIDVEIIDLRTLWPFDLDKILQSVQKTRRAVIVHEAAMTCGLGAELSSRIHERAILSLEAPVGRVTGPDIPFPLSSLEDFYMPNADRVIAGVKKTMNF